MENNSLNPTGVKHIGDPFILHASDGTYYLYATTFTPLNGKEGFNVWVSKNLKDWELKAQAYEVNDESFGYKDFWAPEVVEINGEYIMHYSSRDSTSNGLRIGVAKSSSPLGPFIDVFDKKPMFDLGYSCIDGHVFIDGDKKYLFFSRDCCENVYEGKNESHIYVGDLDDSLTKITNVRFVMRPEKEYETIPVNILPNFCWNEGPCVIKHEGLYYLMYSANYFATKYYCTCYAVSRFPDKGYVKADKPLLSFVADKISGPGHNSVFEDRNGQLMIVYHVHTDSNCPNHDRQMFIDKLKFEGKELMCLGPTIKE